MNSETKQFAPAKVINPLGRGKVVLLCEHASNHVPNQFDNLGMSPSDLESHAAWDPGALELSLLLSRALDAPLIAATVSRLVYDCNRPPTAPSAMPEKSELINVPGNVNMSSAQKDVRIMEVYEPFCTTVTDVLKTRSADTVLVTVHTFTPTYFGKKRSVELGLLHDSDSRLADEMLKQSHEIPNRIVRLNEPYAAEDGVTHSLREFAISRGMANVMLEVRNDLLRTEDDIEIMMRDVLTLLTPALKK